MVTSVRDYGDNQTVVVYTDERSMVDKLRNRKDCINIVRYESGSITVGFDFYFPKSKKRQLLKLAGVKK